jgi:hypothetical protein
MSSTYILLALIVATLVVVVIYFSKSDDDVETNPNSKQLAIEPPNSNNPNAQIQQMMINKEEARQKEHEQYMAQIQSAEQNRQREYNSKMRELEQIREQFEIKKKELEGSEKKEEPNNIDTSTKGGTPKNPNNSKSKKDDEDDSFDAFLGNLEAKSKKK